MSDIEELLLEAYQRAAEAIRPADLRPVPRPPARRRPIQRRRGPGHPLAYPTLAATAVLMVVAAATLLPHFLLHTSAGPAARGRSPALSSKPPAGPPPRFIAALSASGGSIEFVSTSTGKQDARISPPQHGDFFSGLAAEPDDRTFVVAVEQASGGGCTARLFRVRLDQGGQPGGLQTMPEPPIQGILPTSTMALSPNGSELAYFAYQCGGAGDLEVSDLANGTSSTWTGQPGDSIQDVSLSANGAVVSVSGWMFTGYGPGAKQGTSAVRIRPVTAILRPAGAFATIDGGTLVLREDVHVALSPGGTILYACTTQGNRDVLSGYRVATAKPLAVVASWPRDNGSCNFAMAPSGGYILLGDVGGHLAILNTYSGRLSTSTGPGLESARVLTW